MALETASYIADLVITNPDGGDARATADDHLRLIKAVLRRTFPKMDGAVSLSQAQVAYVGDLSASVQSQLNALRDGSATVNNAIYANSAGNVTAFSGHSFGDFVLLNQTNIFPVGQTEAFRFLAPNAFMSWYDSGIARAYLQFGVSVGFVLNVTGNYPISIYQNNTVRLAITDTVITASLPINGEITSANYALFAGTAATANVATTANYASTATNASYADSAGVAANSSLLAGYTYSESDTADTIAKRTSGGYLYARYFNQTSGVDNQSVGHVATMTNLDGFWRPSTMANFGQFLQARNITGRTGTAKNLASGSGPPSLTGSTNGDIWYYY